MASSVAGGSENFRLFSSIRGFLTLLNRVAFYLGMAAISCFFMAIGMKMGTASSTDARRRLVLLMNGTGIALTPLFILVLYTLITGRDFDSIPQSAWIPCILLLAVFPLTLAYVIVVQRALDVRVVVRQGLRYALVTRGVRILQPIAVIAIIGGAVTLAQDPSTRRPQKLTVIGLSTLFVIRLRQGGVWL